MATPVEAPKLGNTVEEVLIARWAKRKGDVKDATITIEAKEGKVTLLAEVKEHPDQKVKLEVTKFDEKS